MLMPGNGDTGCMVVVGPEACRKLNLGVKMAKLRNMGYFGQVRLGGQPIWRTASDQSNRQVEGLWDGEVLGQGGPVGPAKGVRWEM